MCVILGISWKDKVTNEKVREATALPKLEDIIRCRHLRWLGHLSRMDHRRLPWQALTWEPEGFRRRPGRQQQNWKDVIKKNIRKMGTSWDEVEEAAEDSRSWRNRVAQCVFDAGWTRNKEGAFGQSAHLETCCSFGQLRKPNSNHNLTLTLKLTLTLTLVLTLTLTVTLLQLHCMIDQILHDSSNATQLINWLASQHVWSNAQLTKCVLHTLYFANCRFFNAECTSFCYQPLSLKSATFLSLIHPLVIACCLMLIKSTLSLTLS